MYQDLIHSIVIPFILVVLCALEGFSNGAIEVLQFKYERSVFPRLQKWVTENKLLKRILCLSDHRILSFFNPRVENHEHDVLIFSIIPYRFKTATLWHILKTVQVFLYLLAIVVALLNESQYTLFEIFLFFCTCSITRNYFFYHTYNKYLINK